jgi:hypothetical protein
MWSVLFLSSSVVSLVERCKRRELFRFCIALFRGVSVAWLFIALGANARAESKYQEVFASNVRPPNFYVIASEADTSVCRPLLLSLNKEYRIRDDQLEGNPRVSVVSDILLGSDLQVPWTRKLVQQTDAKFYKTSNLDVAQVTLEGRTVSLFRRGLEKFSSELGATLSINRLWMSATALPSFPSDRSLTLKDVTRIQGAEMLVSLAGVRDVEGGANLAARPHGRSLAPPLTLLNVITVSDRLYLLAVDGIEAEVSAPKSNDGTIDLYVLRLLSESDIRAVCRFRSS